MRGRNKASLAQLEGWVSLGESPYGVGVDGGKNSGLGALGHSSVIGQDIEELAKKAYRGVTCEVVGDPGGCE